MQLELAWEQKDQVNEMKAYENIAIAYYYLGNMANANYYMKRIIHGLYEPDTSVIKKVASTMLNNNRERLRTQGFRHIIEDFEVNNKRNDFNISKNIRVNLSQSNLERNKMNNKFDGFNSVSKSSKLLLNLKSESKANSLFKRSRKSCVANSQVAKRIRQKTNFKDKNIIQTLFQRHEITKKYNSKGTDNIVTDKGFKAMIKSIILRQRSKFLIILYFEKF